MLPAICTTVAQITGGSAEGNAQLDNFIGPEKRFPVIATTSTLMSTGVDAQTCKLIVLDQSINDAVQADHRPDSERSRGLPNLPYYYLE